MNPPDPKLAAFRALISGFNREKVRIPDDLVVMLGRRLAAHGSQLPEGTPEPGAVVFHRNDLAAALNAAHDMGEQR